MKSIYWVFTLKCNDFCDHCYNNSGPQGEVVDIADLLRVVPNLPDEGERLILSGGEPLTEMGKLLTLLGALKERYQGRVPIWLQTNGDLLNQRRLEKLLATGVQRIDIASLDRFHRKKGTHINRLRSLFEEFGMRPADDSQEGSATGLTYAMWGANEDLWLGGNWARGRAMETQVSLLDPTHNFCALWSGAAGFLDDGSAQQEVHIQLYRLYPCCPTTLYALGDVRDERVEDILGRQRKYEAFRRLNQGDVYNLGRAEGLDSAYIRQRIDALGDVCLWCDEYFDQHYQGPKGERRAEGLYDIELLEAPLVPARDAAS
ncbi:MAG: radical SAM protein [Candidatus Latescibacteria bacterium]|nr:radical SAM protein [Candidatus Latescibacterota bacterium]